MGDKINAELSAHGGNKVPYLNSLITADEEESANEGTGDGIHHDETFTGGHFKISSRRRKTARRR